MTTGETYLCPHCGRPLWLDFQWFWHADGGHHVTQFYECHGPIRHRFEAERLSEGEHRPVLDVAVQGTMFGEEVPDATPA